MHIDAVRRVLKRLAAKGVLVVVMASKGGIDWAGRGRTNRVRLLMAGLEARNSCAVQGLNPGAAQGLSVGEPLRPIVPTPAPDRLNPCAAQGEHTSEQTSEQTTTTTVVLTPAGLAGGDGGGFGGGGGGGGRRLGRSDEIRREESLVECGVARSRARQFATDREFTEDRIAFAVAQSKKPDTKHPGRLIVSLLEKPMDELDGYERFRRRRVRKRRAGYERILAAGRQVHPDRAEATQVNLDAIRRIWRDIDALAEDGPLPHDDVCDDRNDVAALFARVVAAARQHAEQPPASLEACPDDDLQCQRDHRQPHAGKEDPWPA